MGNSPTKTLQHRMDALPNALKTTARSVSVGLLTAADVDEATAVLTRSFAGASGVGVGEPHAGDEEHRARRPSCNGVNGNV